MAITFTDGITQRLAENLAKKATVTRNTINSNPTEPIKINELLKKLSSFKTKEMLHGDKSSEDSRQEIINELSEEI
ncbi:MAG: hypothetical protein HRT47_11320 [Candidatus Caenarcaniphilales bacterium]|nr:hypothetical protein [Candidatus Caenarcaniphilales bacterium]